MRAFASVCFVVVASALLVAQTPAPAVSRGIYRFAGGRPTFQPCGSEARLAVRDETSMGEMTTILSMLGADRRPAIFMQVRGVRTAAAIRIVEIQRAEAESRGCVEDLKTIVLKARGNEPFWSLDVASSGIRFQRVEDAQPISFPYQPFQAQAGVWLFAAEHNKTRFAVVIKSQRCNDGMSGSVYPLTAEIDFGSASYKGCAYPGDLFR